MDEKRKSMRRDLVSSVVMKRIDNGESGEYAVSLINMSESGIGFECRNNLELDTIYEVFITIWTKEVIHVMAKIVRRTESEKGYTYGASFIGLTDLDRYRISLYNTVEMEKSKTKE